LVGGVARALTTLSRVAFLIVVLALAWAAPAAASDVYVANGGGPSSGTVSQFDVGAAGALAPKSPATVLAGASPQGVAVSLDGSSVYVTNSPSSPRKGTVSQYNVGAGGALAPKSPAMVGAGVGAFEVAVSPDGHSVYVTNANARSVSQYNVGAGGALAPKSPPRVAAGQSPGGVAVSPDGHSVYVTNVGSGTVSQYDVGVGGVLAHKKPAATVGAGAGPFDVAVSPDGHSVYVTNLGSNNIWQYNVGAGGALAPKSPATVSSANGPGGIAVSPDGHSVYVTNSPSTGMGTVSQYNVGAGGALAPKSPPTVSAGNNPGKVAVSPDGHNAYVTNSNSGDVSQYDVGAGGALAPKSPATVAAGTNPFGIAVRPTLGTPPPAPTIGDVIASVQALGLPSGIEHTLLVKLTGAQQDLEANSRAGACGKLGSFINQVKAQSAKQIPANDAQALTDQATAVSQSLGCGGG
jgi:DNA-binding beta-propeller fold protein YncE